MTVTGNSISFQPLNANTVRIIGSPEEIIPHFKDGEIISLELPTKSEITEKLHTRAIAVGETFRIKSVPYKINIIKEAIDETDELCYDLIMTDRTKTSLFILPMLGGNRRLLFYDSLLINAYLETKNKEDYIILLYRKSRKKVFTEFIDLLQQLKSFESIEAPNPHCYIIKFRLPLKHKRNLQMFKIGKYSKFKDEYKLDILDFHRYDIDGRMGQILFKSSERRRELEEKLDAILPKDSELYSIMNKEHEQLNLKNYF